MSFLGTLLDERFRDHRRRSTSVAGVITGLVALGLFAYRFYFQHEWSWDLFTVALAYIVVKLALMLWYVLTD